MASRTSKPGARKASSKRNASKSTSAKRGRQSGKPSLGREIWLVSWGIIGILIGLLFFALCAGFWYGSGEIVGIIEEINERDFTVMSQREELYDVFFTERDDQGYMITKEDKKIFDGVVSYMWRVQPPGSSELREFGWEHDLESNEVHQTTNGALLLDIKLDIISQEAAMQVEIEGAKERFNPDDPIAYGIVHDDIARISQGSLNTGWDDSLPTDNQVLLPVMSHEEAKNRKAEQLKAMAPEEIPGEHEEPVEPSEDVVEITPAGEE